MYETMTHKLDALISESSRGDSVPTKISISSREFRQFMRENKEIYKKQYGGFISVPEVEEMNILYRGVAICIDTPTRLSQLHKQYQRPAKRWRK